MNLVLDADNVVAVGPPPVVVYLRSSVPCVPFHNLNKIDNVKILF